MLSIVPQLGPGPHQPLSIQVLLRPPPESGVPQPRRVQETCLPKAWLAQPSLPHVGSATCALGQSVR